MSGDSHSVSRILRESSPDDRHAVDRVFSLVYDELRRMAHAQLARGPSGQTMSTTVLIHEAYLRLADRTGTRFPDRAHFYGYAARVMRSVLVDHARSRGAGKRGGGLQPVPLDRCDLPIHTQAELVVGIDDALTRLAALDERLARVVECRFFGGMTEVETATVLGVTERTVRRDWIKARTWLHAELADGNSGPEPGASSS
jgi:RNA polymerase sigma factor (TIGR02999 family)